MSCHVILYSSYNTFISVYAVPSLVDCFAHPRIIIYTVLDKVEYDILNYQDLILNLAVAGNLDTSFFDS